MTIEEHVKEVIVEKLGVDKSRVIPGADIICDLGADSLDQVELVMALEDEFDIEVPEEDAEKLKKVKDITAYVEAKK